MWLKADGKSGPGQRYRCRACGRTRTDRTGTPFAGYRLPREVIVMAVRWYGRFRLSLRDVCELLAERGVDVAPSTAMRWVHTFGPLLGAELHRRARPLGSCWYADETYVRVGGRWAYLYRAVDETGQVVDVLLREQRDLASARAFFEQATRRRGSRPCTVVTDKHPAYGRAVRRHARRATHIKTGLHRARGGTTKPIERSHAPVKDRLRAMRGLQSVTTGQRVLDAVEVMQAIRRGDWRHPVPPFPAAMRAYEHVRCEVMTLLLLANDLRAGCGTP
jgi:IS6 family transposase